VAGRIPHHSGDDESADHPSETIYTTDTSTGARASELLGVLAGGMDPGQRLVTVIRKGSRAIQQLPASPDAFVWKR
jgi:hypothetical protein